MDEDALAWLTAQRREADAREQLLKFKEWRSDVDADWAIPLQQHFNFVDSDEYERNLLRDWWASVSELFRRLSILSGQGKSISPLPTEIFGMFRAFAADLAAGIVPVPIRDVSGPGQPGSGFSEARAIGLAVAYVKACRGELTWRGEAVNISDRHPNKTIQNAYGVKASTVKGWVRNRPIAELGVRPIHADTLRDIMMDAGERYRMGVGRGQASIQARAARI